MITEGELILTVGGETKRLGVRQWYHIPAGAEHSAEFTEDTSQIEFWFRAK